MSLCVIHILPPEFGERYPGRFGVLATLDFGYPQSEELFRLAPVRRAGAYLYPVRGEFIKSRGNRCLVQPVTVLLPAIYEAKLIGHQVRQNSTGGLLTPPASPGHHNLLSPGDVSVRQQSDPLDADAQLDLLVKHRDRPQVWKPDTEGRRCRSTTSPT